MTRQPLLNDFVGQMIKIIDSSLNFGHTSLNTQKFKVITVIMDSIPLLQPRHNTVNYYSTIVSDEVMKKWVSDQASRKLHSSKQFTDRFNTKQDLVFKTIA